MKRNFQALNWDNVPIEEYDLVRHFVEINNRFPNNTCFLSSDVNGYISYDLVRAELVKRGATSVFKSSINKSGVRKDFLLLDNKFILLEGIFSKTTDMFDSLPDSLKDNYSFSVVGQITILFPTDELEKDIQEIIDSATFKTVYYPTVGVISRDSNGFYLNEILLEAEICKDLELHYGEGFNEFHDKLLKRLISKNKGISLFHGVPGSGKTYYINRLIFDLKEHSNKKIILIPTNMVSYLLEPDFNTFLIDLVNESVYEDEDFEEETISENGDIANGIIFIIEDAEPVLLKRDDNYNAQSTSNILNLTDGLLNTIFKIQIVATYNTDDSNIDEAVMRDKRLIAKRMFDKLPKESAKKLATSLGIDENIITEDTTVASIYALLDKDDDIVLIDDKRNTEPKNKAGLKLN